MWKIGVILLSFLALSTSLSAQSFDITEAGEIDLDSDLITDQNRVENYFGMYVSGLGDSFIRVSSGTQSASKDYEFKLSETKLTSFLLNNELAEEVSVEFRRGVFGSVNLEILNVQGEVQDSVVIAFDKTYKKKNCTKFPSKKLKKCGRVDLAKAKPKVVKKFLDEFLSSIKGPIVLEP